jgi:phenylacetic acid degradation protein
MPLYEFEGKRPCVAPTAYIHPQAVLIGSVRVGENCFVGAGAVLRADWGEIVIGEGSNIQENAVMHAGYGAVNTLGHDSHVGHGAILHNCRLDEHVMVGMGAIINDEVRIGDGAVVGAGAVVPPRAEIPPRKVVMGVPAKVVRDVDDRMEQFTWWGTRTYQTLPERYHGTLREATIQECRLEEP